jgi:branched-chain amino acid transport system substrate-binding protein
MRSIQDRIFLSVLLLAIIASTSVAAIAVTGASSHVTVTLQGGGDFTSSASATAATGGSTTVSSGGGSGSGYTGGGGGGGANNTQGVTGDTIKVGGIFSTGGIDATIEKDTVQACFDMYNLQGGVNGHKLQLVAYDDGMDSNQAALLATKLDQQDHVFAIVGWLAPFGEASAAPYFEQQGIPIVGGLGVPEEFNSPVSFPVTPIFKTDGYGFGAYATNPSGPLHFHHPGVFLVQTAGINDVADGMKAGAAKNGVTIDNRDIFFTSFTTPAATYQQDLLQMGQDGVDGLITQLDPFSYVRLYSAEQGAGKNYPHLAGAGIDKQNVDQQLGNQLVGAYSFMPVLEAQGNPAGNGEVALYNSTVARFFPSQVPNMDAFSEGSWVACRIFVQGLAKLGANITRSGLVQALNSGPYDTGGMAPELNWGQAGSEHAAAHCVSFITYTSSHHWAIASGFSPATCYYYG